MVHIQLIKWDTEVVGQIMFDFNKKQVTFEDCDDTRADKKVPLELSKLSGKKSIIWMVRRDGDRFTILYDGNIAAKFTCPNRFASSVKIDKMKLSRAGQTQFVNLPGKMQVKFLAHIVYYNLYAMVLMCQHHHDQFQYSSNSNPTQIFCETTTCNVQPKVYCKPRIYSITIYFLIKIVKISVLLLSIILVLLLY